MPFNKQFAFFIIMVLCPAAFGQRYYFNETTILGDCQPLQVAQFESIVSSSCLAGLQSAFTDAIQTQLCALLDDVINEDRGCCYSSCSSSGSCDFSSECTKFDIDAADKVCESAGLSTACLATFSDSSAACSITNMPAVIMCQVSQCSDADNQAMLSSFEVGPVTNGEWNCDGISPWTVVGIVLTLLISSFALCYCFRHRCCCWNCLTCKKSAPQSNITPTAQNQVYQTFDS